MKIILADDSSTIRSIVSKLLMSLGYEDIIQVDCGEDVLARLKEHPDVKLILLDWNMPLMNGFECLKVIKSDSATKDIPVIMVTAEAQISRIKEAVRSGACNYLLKPFDKEKLQAAVAMALGAPAN